jgi:hypothetical protein
VLEGRRRRLAPISILGFRSIGLRSIRAALASVLRLGSVVMVGWYQMVEVEWYRLAEVECSSRELGRRRLRKRWGVRLLLGNPEKSSISSSRKTVGRFTGAPATRAAGATAIRTVSGLPIRVLHGRSYTGGRPNLEIFWSLKNT